MRSPGATKSIAMTISLVAHLAAIAGCIWLWDDVFDPTRSAGGRSSAALGGGDRANVWTVSLEVAPEITAMDAADASDALDADTSAVRSAVDVQRGAPTPAQSAPAPVDRPGPPTVRAAATGDTPERRSDVAAEPARSREAAPVSRPDLTWPHAASAGASTRTASAASGAGDAGVEASNAGPPHAWPGPGQVDRAARPRRPIRPAYPRRARRRGEESTVVIQAWVDERGDVSFASVVESGGSEFDESARFAVNRSHFEPALLAGESVASRVALRIHFDLYD